MAPKLDNHRYGIAGPCNFKPEDEHCMSCILDDSDYFAGLSIDAKVALQHGMQLKTFPRRAVLYREGSRNNHLYILISGEVKVSKSTVDGRQQIHKIAPIPGDLIACEDLFLNTSSSTAIAITDSAVACIKRDFIRDISADYPEILDTIMQAMARNLNSYIRNIANLAARNAESRLAAYLFFQYDSHKQGKAPLNFLADSLTRGEMADMLGMTQRTLLRSLKRLEQKKIISLAKSGFAILDLAALRQIADGA